MCSRSFGCNFPQNQPASTNWVFPKSCKSATDGRRFDSRVFSACSKRNIRKHVHDNHPINPPQMDANVGIYLYIYTFNHILHSIYRIHTDSHHVTSILYKLDRQVADRESELDKFMKLNSCLPLVDLQLHLGKPHVGQSVHSCLGKTQCYDSHRYRMI